MAASSGQRWMMMLGNVGIAICISYALLYDESFDATAGARIVKNRVSDMPQSAFTVLQQWCPVSASFQESQQCNW
jgi:hypothetical protein